MRGTTNSCEVIAHDETIIGLNLGFDFCAEHEFGYRWAREELGLGQIDGAIGVPARTTTKMNLELELVEFEDELWLRGQPKCGYSNSKGLLAELQGEDRERNYYMNDMMKRRGWEKGADIRAGWSDTGGFMVVASTDKGREAVKLVHQALLDNKCFINQASGFMGRGGLCLLDARLIPAKFCTQMADADYSAIALQVLVNQSGILQRLKDAGKRYYACSPRWVNEERGEFMFWLNPQEQDKNNFGWMSVQDLDDWIAGKGKVPKG